MGISYWQFGTLPIGLFLSNLESRQLETSHDILWLILKYVNFWLLQGHLSILGKIGCLQKINFFFVKEWQHFNEVWGGLGGQVPRLYGGTIFGGFDTLRGVQWGIKNKGFWFLTHLWQRVLGIDWFHQESVHRCSLGYSTYLGLNFEYVTD